jgi:hypothetical protein
MASQASGRMRVEMIPKLANIAGGPGWGW